ncbi:protein longifolia 1 [Phtheirospermum japonicum]|uniref:Protein longifolia 1 n=1 Tax=Phtheirospermum japonicum TaxID=374723 RepID=A0A830CID0_9LAMI|nr:protein longifolia 1 [Phtheirospermum japonicum]
MTTGLVKEHNLEKQMGCMAGFLQIFDRHQILSGKRHYSAKRLPPLSPVTDTTSESEKSAPASPAISERPTLSPATELRSPPPHKSPLLPVLELKEGTRSPWKFGKETPRLSLDSRATTDAKGGLHPKEIRTAASILSAPAANRCESVASDGTDDSQQHRSPSVIARLMGLEPLLPDSSVSEPETKPQLRRSASESRVSRDLFQSRFTADNKPAHENGVKDTTMPIDAQYADPNNYNCIIKIAHNAEPTKGFNSPSPWKAPPHHHRKSFFDSGDFFPEPKQTPSMYGEIESRLRIRGIEEPSKDLETLKQILEALQLKGLLHSSKPPEQNQVRHRNFVYDESPIVVMKPSRLSNPTPVNRRGNDWSPSNGSNQIRSPPVSPRRERNARGPNGSGRSPSPTASTRNEGSGAAGRRSNSLVKPKPLSVETQRRKTESTETRRVSPVHSPRLNPRKAGPDPTASNRSPSSRKSSAEIHQKEKIATVAAAAEDESSSISGSSITTSTDTERSKTEDYKEGRHLLERCGKLLHSIAEMTAADMQPSPVSVLDSSFYKDESSTPSPVTTRRNIDFKDQSGEIEDYEIWSPTISLLGSKSDDSDFVYVSDILRASHYLPDESDMFVLLEKQQYLKGNDTSKGSKLQRKLVFDTVNEILNRNNRLPPWKLVSLNNHDFTKPSINRVWSEFERIRERDAVAEDLFETVCGVLKKDLAGDGVNGWGDCPVEMSEAILDIERLIFKDLIGETIRDLAALATRSTLSSMMMPRRKLVF